MAVGHHIKASYNGVNIELGNIGIGQTDKDKWDKCTTYSLFCGTWLICDFGRKPECVVSVSSLEKNADFFSKRERRVIIDDEQFSKRFCVNANDPREAFAILTPQMMETILTVADKSGGQVYISFMPDGKMNIGIDTGRYLFDAKKCHDVEELRQKFSEELRRLTDIIDTLNVG